MTRAPLHVRVAVMAVALMVAGIPTWAYVATHDLERPLSDFLQGKERVTWPPPPKPGARGGGDVADDLLATALAPLRYTALALFTLAGAVAVNRTRRRIRRGDEVETFELRLGRDDLSNPFKVQEAFEGLAGSLTVRWYQRIWSGQPHLALEIHRGALGEIAFTAAGPPGTEQVVSAALKELYPDVSLELRAGRPPWTHAVMRLKKARSYVLSIQTLRNYEHAFSESLVSTMDTTTGAVSVQLVLTPAPKMLHRRSRALLKRRERGLNYQDRRDELDPGAQSVVEFKELRGALETQHRSLLYFDLRVCAEHGRDAATVAGLFAQLRSENELVRRDMRVRRGLYARRIERAIPNPVPGTRTGVLSTSELATLWQLPRARVKDARLSRSSVRRAVAPPEIDRDPAHRLLEDERGPVGIAPADRKYGHALIGGQGGGKSSVIARRVHSEASTDGAAIVLLDPKGPLAELALGLVPRERIVHYLDLGAPEIGFNPLTLDAGPGARASLVMAALIEANPPGAIQAASDSFLRQALSAVCAGVAAPTFWHVYRMLDFQAESPYRQRVVESLEGVAGTDFARSYWRREFPALLGDRGFAAQALNPPRNKIERLISTSEIDLLLRHPVAIDLAGIIERGEVLIVNGAKATVGEDNTVFVMQLLVQLLHRTVQAQQHLPDGQRRRVALFFDEAHNLLTKSVATMLAEGRSAGLEATFAWQYSAQVVDEVIRSGLRSLLQSLSIFRMREMEDARSLAGLAMEVYSDRISVDLEEQERLRFSADDIVKLPIHRAINLWIAGGVPRSGFIAETLAMEDLHNEDLAEHHQQAQRDRGGHFPGFLPDPLAGHEQLAIDATPPKCARATRKPEESTPPAPPEPVPDRVPTTRVQDAPEFEELP